MSVLIFLDGVMRKTDNAPLLQGVLLFRALQSQKRTVILCSEKDKAEVWLKQNNILKVDDIISYEDAKTENPKELVEHCRSRGSVDFVVTADPSLSVELLEVGISALLFLSPKYIRPEFRPDARRGVKSWDDLQAELDRQEELYREDPRL